MVLGSTYNHIRLNISYLLFIKNLNKNNRNKIGYQILSFGSRNAINS
ncbi:hypothetical protein LV83_01552 [Algoriphagus yeomjeoni]|uniref:Uncharacterized protein n=1 Tax=Algoriphagus yeomjeoni TaxID=291403 RepID=A0A327PIP2_9BACT|nr:hypothetical protein LV83_01552 [Algoriphagus yeomjeoni]